MTYRDTLIQIANDFQNGWITVEAFARHHHLTNDDTIALLSLALEVRAKDSVHA